MMPASIINSLFEFLETLQPRFPSNVENSLISDKNGTDFKVVFPAVKMAAAIIGSEAFFEPLTVTEPESLTGPSM
jgi:hypothetical protein